MQGVLVNATRARLVEICERDPSRFDCGFTNFVQVPDDIKAELRQRFGTKPPISTEKQYKYKYLIMVDGNTAPSSRSFHTFTSSGSLILWQVRAT